MATVKSDQDLNCMLIYLFYAIRVCVTASVIWSVREGLLCIKANVSRKKV